MAKLQKEDNYMSRKVTLKELELEFEFASVVMKEVLKNFTFNNVCRCNKYLSIEVNSSPISELDEKSFNMLSLEDGSVEMLRVETAHVYLYAFHDNNYAFDKTSISLSDVYGNDLPDENGLEVVDDVYLDKYFIDENDEMELDKYYVNLEKLYKEF